MMKAKAEAEAKEMQAKGLKRGEDFVDCEPPPSSVVYARAHVCCTSRDPRAQCGGCVKKVSAVSVLFPRPRRPCAVICAVASPPLPALPRCPLRLGLNAGGLASSFHVPGPLSAYRGATCEGLCARAFIPSPASAFSSSSPVCGTPGSPLCFISAVDFRPRSAHRHPADS